MTNKNFLSKMKELKAQAPLHGEVERKLVPRLKLMGYILLTLCLVSFVFALTIEEADASIETSLNEEPLADDAEIELLPTEVLNFYAVSSIFALIGGSCFLIAWKKNKAFAFEVEIPKE